MWTKRVDPPTRISRREAICGLGGGFGALALGSMLTAPSAGAATAPLASTLDPKAPHVTPWAKRIIFLFMNGGPSHVDTFDPKPALMKYSGQIPDAIQLKTGRKKGTGLMPSPFTFKKYGPNGTEVSELYPE